MEPCDELMTAVKKSNADASLYRTGFLMSENIEVLQLTWIKLVATLGEYCNIPIKKWLDVIKDIRNFILNEEVEVKLGFIITTKLCLLFHTEGYQSFPKKTLAIMRTNIVGMFDECLLSEKGLNMFTSILPKPSNEREFCLKIISGFVTHWKKEKRLLVREALEYVCRKDYSITGDFVDVLWGFLNIFLRNATENAFILYQCFYKKKEKSWRCGLLYGFHNLLNDPISTGWNDKEDAIIYQIELMTPDLWKEFRTEKPKLEYELDKLSILETYFPSRSSKVEEPSEPFQDFIEEKRKIVVKK